ncbi:glycosyltransferase family 87 protein [Actinokineospora bangkokensis]|uniref:DUF2029 domain-containing protein n=1 Tax=Actinokineospora bangkokensis TaxID=1193682 RepID=A0A1Q9LJD3_9PSEU|nr:glycosyltransferase 87 family protein [Actinokineospora bangkokensis]OLR92089.1 hypothetical protein BJP25_22320 [Actinokineospora bangkokensis]
MSAAPAELGPGTEPTATPAPRPPRTAVWVVLGVAVLALGLAFLAKAPCLGTYVDDFGITRLDWRDGLATREFCYSDTIPLFGQNGLADGLLPYAHSWVDLSSGAPRVRFLEYPVLTGVFMYAAARLNLAYRAVVEVPEPVIPYFAICAVFLALAWLLVVWSCLRLFPRRPWVVLLVAASPLVVVHAFTNFDTLAVAAATLALLAWARSRTVLAGVLLGVGCAFKLYPVLLVGALLVVCLRARRMQAFWSTTGAALVTWVVINAPFALLPATKPGWGEFFRLNTTRDMDPDSVYFVLRSLTPWEGFDPQPLVPGVGPSNLNTISLLLFLVVCAFIAYLGLSAPARPRVAQLGFLVVAAFLLTNKVWSPQYSLWLVPLAVLALPRWKPLLAWMVVDAAVWFPRMRWFGQVDVEPTLFLWTVVARDALLLLLCALVVREILRPDRDGVRAGGGDPLAGDTADHPDAWRLRGLRVVRPSTEEPAHAG